MTYFPDLSIYSYGRGIRMDGNLDENVLHVGWLDDNHPYPKGEVTEEFLEKLLLFCHLAVRYARGHHICDLCENLTFYDEVKVQYGNGILRLGNGEVLVFGKKKRIYMAPTLIYHYIVEHKYHPPEEFIEAVLTSPRPDSAEYDAALEQYGWWPYDKLYHQIRAELAAKKKSEDTADT